MKSPNIKDSKDYKRAHIFNKKWIKKQREKGEDFRGFSWGMSIAGVLIIIVTIVFLINL